MQSCVRLYPPSIFDADRVSFASFPFSTGSSLARTSSWSRQSPSSCIWLRSGSELGSTPCLSRWCSKDRAGLNSSSSALVGIFSASQLVPQRSVSRFFFFIEVYHPSLTLLVPFFLSRCRSSFKQTLALSLPFPSTFHSRHLPNSLVRVLQGHLVRRSSRRSGSSVPVWRRTTSESRSSEEDDAG